MNYPKSYCVFDFETTGLDPLTSKVLEVGAIKVVNGEIVDRLSFLIKWPEPVPANIVTITGITQDMVDKDGRDPFEAQILLKLFIKDQVLIGHNIFKFDLNFLYRFLELLAAEREAISFIDTAAHVKGKKINMELKEGESYVDWVKEVMDTKAFGVKFNVGLTCDELGIDKSSGQHRAMNDVLLTNEIYKKICV